MENPLAILVHGVNEQKSMPPSLAPSSKKPLKLKIQEAQNLEHTQSRSSTLVFKCSFGNRGGGRRRFSAKTFEHGSIVINGLNMTHVCHMTHHDSYDSLWHMAHYKKEPILALLLVSSRYKMLKWPKSLSTGLRPRSCILSLYPCKYPSNRVP